MYSVWVCNTEPAHRLQACWNCRSANSSVSVTATIKQPTPWPISITEAMNLCSVMNLVLKKERSPGQDIFNYEAKDPVHIVSRFLRIVTLCTKKRDKTRCGPACI